jgi:hypothetical protein
MKKTFYSGRTLKQQVGHYMGVNPVFAVFY